MASSLSGKCVQSISIDSMSEVLHRISHEMTLPFLHSDARWQWTEDCGKAFRKAKETLTSSHLLIHYDLAQHVQLAADASDYGIGAVISHVMKDGTERPIAYASRTLSQTERNYAQLEKEALALIFGIKKFHQYLFGRHFTLITDHKPLMAILGSKKGIPPLAAARLQRWALILATYNYQLEFRPTQSHSNADGLSRLPLPSEKTPEYSSEPSVLNTRQIEALPVTTEAVQQAIRKDSILSKVLHYTRRGWPTPVPEALKSYFSQKTELTIEDNGLL